MKTPVLHFVFLALLGSFFTPLAVAYASPSPTDSMHFDHQALGLTVRFEDMPTAHDGGEFTFELHFSKPIKISYKTVRDHVFDVTGGTVKRARRLQKGSNLGWQITIEPDSDEEVSIVLSPPTDCDAAGAVCTTDGRPLTNGLAAIVPAIVPLGLTACFEVIPAVHDGRKFKFELHFSEQIDISYKTVRDHVFDVTGGTATKARRLKERLEDGKVNNTSWQITIKPDSNAEVSIVLPLTNDCEANGAVCTEDGRSLANGLTAIVPGPAAKLVVVPLAFALDASYPNPFNAETLIPYSLPVAGPVELAIYNIMGQKVRTLVQGEQAAGRHQIAWDGRSDRGSSLASGVYLSRLASPQGVQVRQLLFLQ